MRVRVQPRTRVQVRAPVLPKPCEPVTGKYVNGNGLENEAWLNILAPFSVTRFDNTRERRRRGADPREIPLAVLAASGHPKRSATKCIRIYMRDLELDRDSKVDRGLKRLRKMCLECAENESDVRYCTIINCPLWAHRMGKNPFNKRGKRGTAKAS